LLARGLAVLMIGLGVVILVRTIALGGHGFAYGFLVGTLLVFAGVLRLYLSRQLS
jgi:hypothetical protein